ncbi:hypothetical protein MNBD_GAMMA20-252 [hydrothermal vent metagenome]|uniref:PDZ domain-containing protein n=1 Tax=hydrothermal vent metagenome TaxID=652676 RepID=A0A3B0ZVI8_9ZZZZ
MGKCVLTGFATLIVGVILGWHFHSLHQDFALSKPVVPHISELVIGSLADCCSAEMDVVVKNSLVEEKFVYQQLRQGEKEFETSPSIAMDKGISTLFKIKNMGSRGPISLLSISLKDVLSNAGIEQKSVKQIIEQIGKNKMDLLSLRDLATREGWLDTPKYIDARAIFADPYSELRTELGDRVYDRYLYAIGKDNRIRIGEVYQNSQAEALGFMRGDMIIKYGPEYIFTMTDLIQATSGGDAEEPMLVEFQRDGMHMYETVQRGPLGIEMEAVSQMPVGSVKY